MPLGGLETSCRDCFNTLRDGCLVSGHHEDVLGCCVMEDASPHTPYSKRTGIVTVQPFTCPLLLLSLSCSLVVWPLGLWMGVNPLLQDTRLTVTPRVIHSLLYQGTSLLNHLQPSNQDSQHHNLPSPGFSSHKFTNQLVILEFTEWHTNPDSTEAHKI